MAALAACTLLSCEKQGGREDAQQAISFTAQTSEMTKAEGPETRLDRDFVVFGEKQMEQNGGWSTVFPWYNVKYVNNTYNYQGLTSRLDKPQDKKFWDSGANSYRFAAFSYAGDVTIETAGTPSITVAGIDTSSVLMLAGYSDNMIGKTDIGKTVKLNFKAVQPRIRIGLYESMSSHSITNVSWTLEGIFPQSAESMTVRLDSLALTAYTATKPDRSSLSDSTCTGGKLMSTTSANPDYSEPVVVMPSTAEMAEYLKMTLSYDVIDNLTGGRLKEENRVAYVPAELAVWSPARAYSYLFKITRTDLIFEGYSTLSFELIDWGDHSEDNVIDDLGGLM